MIMTRQILMRWVRQDGNLRGGGDKTRSTQFDVVIRDKRLQRILIEELTKKEMENHIQSSLVWRGFIRWPRMRWKVRSLIIHDFLRSSIYSSIYSRKLLSVCGCDVALLIEL